MLVVTRPLQSWFEREEQKMVQELSMKLDNLDARDTRQLNEVYAEVKRVEGIHNMQFLGGAYHITVPQ